MARQDRMDDAATQQTATQPEVATPKTPTESTQQPEAEKKGKNLFAQKEGFKILMVDPAVAEHVTVKEGSEVCKWNGEYSKIGKDGKSYKHYAFNIVYARKMSDGNYVLFLLSNLSEIMSRSESGNSYREGESDNNWVRTTMLVGPEKGPGCMKLGPKTLALVEQFYQNCLIWEQFHLASIKNNTIQIGVTNKTMEAINNNRTSKIPRPTPLFAKATNGYFFLDLGTPQKSNKEGASDWRPVLNCEMFNLKFGSPSDGGASSVEVGTYCKLTDKVTESTPD